MNPGFSGGILRGIASLNSSVMSSAQSRQNDQSDARNHELRIPSGNSGAPMIAPRTNSRALVKIPVSGIQRSSSIPESFSRIDTDVEAIRANTGLEKFISQETLDIHNGSRFRQQTSLPVSALTRVSRVFIPGAAKTNLQHDSRVGTDVTPAYRETILKEPGSSHADLRNDGEPRSTKSAGDMPGCLTSFVKRNSTSVSKEILPDLSEEGEHTNSDANGIA